MTFILIIAILVCGFILIKGTDLTIKSLSKISRRMGWREYIISFTLIATATSLPEIIVGISSSLQKVNQLSLGNVIGANIINLTLILGLCSICAKKIKIDGQTKIKNILLAMFFSFLPIVLALDGKLSRVDGLILLLVFVFYMSYMIKEERGIRPEIEIDKNGSLIKIIILLLLGLVLLIGGAEILIIISKVLTDKLNIPLIIVGFVLIALSTTTPELIFGIRSAIKKYEGMALGDTLGSVVVNSNLALGLASFIFPITITAYSSFLLSAFFFLITLIISFVFIRTGKELSWKEGVILVFFYIIFVIFQLI